MNDKVDIVELENNLDKIISRKDGASFKQVYDLLYDIRLLKYVRQSQIKLITNNKNKPKYSKVSALEMLCEYANLGLLDNTQEDIFISTVKSFILLKQLKYPVGLLPKNIEGNGSINEINNTAVFIQALKLPDFKALLYPNFGYLKPDSLLVRAKDGMYKLEFLEVEASKSNWNDWLENKRVNYLKLASCKDFYHYWNERCHMVDIPPINVNNFKFSVYIVGKINKDFGTGFNFVESLNG